jgi:simple sugar transport system permease protein
MALSGALAGVGGASEIGDFRHVLDPRGLQQASFGYAGIVVAMVAALSPLAVIPAAIFIAGVFVGADTMSRTIGVSNYIADLIVALALLCVLVSGLCLRFRVRFG